MWEEDIDKLGIENSKRRLNEPGKVYHTWINSNNFHQMCLEAASGTPSVLSRLMLPVKYKYEKDLEIKVIRTIAACLIFRFS